MYVNPQSENIKFYPDYEDFEKSVQVLKTAVILNSTSKTQNKIIFAAQYFFKIHHTS